MLNHNTIPSRLGYYILTGILVATIMFLLLKVGHYEGDIRTLNIQRNWTEGENKTLKDREKQYIEALTYYQTMLKSARQMTEDVVVNLKKGTIVIPPVEQGEGA